MAWSPPTGAKPFDVHDIIARLVDGSEFDDIQEAVRPDPDLRFRPYLGLSGRRHRQQRHPVQREFAEGRPFHRAVLPANIPLVPAGNNGFMVGKKYEAGGTGAMVPSS